ncbi:hypothetical protein ORK51_10500 [Stenotrophomonas rhizophila]|uniref:hypothetical protein n=1 Tax=Stenotrophomonas rhizophila TaxID=216778 RepID=UPI00224B5907|nr:hypothetical protein [Stenotrophomonas rhizophila]MCX2920601.1 hypothetical protein [Stenotrophomonas rhizophila]
MNEGVESKYFSNGVDRALIAYAFLAYTKSDPADLTSGLAPMFAPIARALQGESFSADVFADKLNEFYGIKIHPWAVDDLTPRLEACGILKRVPLSESTVTYVYATPSETRPGDHVTEAQVRSLLSDFSTFACDQFNSHGVEITDAEAEKVFLEYLVLTDFSLIRSKPSVPAKNSDILSLRKDDDSQDDFNVAKRSQLLTVCASYILNMFEYKRETYDLIVRLAHGALLAEVVLNVKEPGSKADLRRLTVVLDAPLVMSILDVRNKESTSYARAFLDDLKAKQASIKIFSHSIQEIEYNIKSVVDHVARGQGHGATASRLCSDHSFRVYVDSLRSDVRGAVERFGIKVIESPDTPQSYQIFSREAEDAFASDLGPYNNYQAKIRDAKSVAGVIRLRRGNVSPFKSFDSAAYIFVTENDRIADRSSKLVLDKKRKVSSAVPAAFTDRFFAGLMWVTFGGVSEEVTRHRLLASCVSALEPNTDVVTKVHQFLAGLDVHKADHFRALMTEERSGQHVMQLTLGDPLMVRSTEDASELMRKLEERYIERGRLAGEEQLSAAHQYFDSEMAHLSANHEELVRSIQSEAHDRDEASHREIKALKEASASDSIKIELLEGALGDFRKELDSTKLRDLKRDLNLLSGFASSAQRTYRLSERVAYAVVALLLVVVAVVPAAYSGRLSDGGLAVLTTTSVLLGILGFWRLPDLIFGGVAKHLREKKFKSNVALHSLDWLNSECTIDWERNTITYSGCVEGIQSQTFL